MSKVYRVLVLGTGFGRRVQLPVFAAHPRFEVVGVASGRAERAQETAAEFGIAHHSADWQALMRDVPHDMVSVVTPVDLHLASARATLEAGKHLLLEKPVGMHAGEAEELLAASRNSVGASAVNHEFRYRPEVLTAHRMIRDGRLGTVRSLEIRNVSSFWADPQKASFGWLSRADRGGGLLGALGSHNVDTAHFLTGLRTVQARGAIWTAVPQRNDAQGVAQSVTADDSASFVLTLEHGVHAEVSITGAAWWEESLIRVHGTQGTLSIEASGMRFRPAGGEVASIQPDPDLDWELSEPDVRRPLFARLLDRFARRCDGEVVDDLSTLEEGVAIMRVLDTVRG